MEKKSPKIGKKTNRGQRTCRILRKDETPCEEEGGPFSNGKKIRRQRKRIPQLRGKKKKILPQQREGEKEKGQPERLNPEKKKIKQAKEKA